ncbi:GatB/YqeY domain-containing protein [Rhodococcus sp. X156]|uniref:GatB/YqeY domain-containing protein n=1 Tax=Rhodococcus sp. X156 TaxID=2499145 RepID=UPI000FDA88CD|nr:GatB/YqeY domain-containing protein [Rhodococcus sp. X156]
MAELKQRIKADLTTAMKAKDALTVSTLRMVLSALQYEEVSGKQARELTDEDVLRVLARESKKRGESAEAFDGAGRGELADKERAEAQVIDAYLPTQLSDAEVDDVVARAVAAVAETTGEQPGQRQMGQVMKEAGALAAGRADGKRLSAAVRAALAG